MADNYLEKRAQEVEENLHRGSRKASTRVVKPLDSLLKKNRSFRGYDPSRVVTEAELREIVSVASFVPSGMNRQPLRFRLVLSSEASKLHPLYKLGAALPEEHLPKPGTEPGAFIVVCSAVPEDRVVDMDLGIAAQSMLLKATEMGLGGIFILNFDVAAVREALGLSLTPIALIAIGKGAESIFLIPADKGQSLKYFRRDGVHFVPKLTLDDILL